MYQNTIVIVTTNDNFLSIFVFAMTSIITGNKLISFKIGISVLIAVHCFPEKNGNSEK